MPTSFPTSIDAFSDPTPSTQVSVLSHAAQHANANDAIEALEAKVGVNASADTSSLDYKLGQVTDRAVGLAATQTLSNKTLTAPAITSPTTTGTDTGTETMTNKTLTDPTNNVLASSLKSATTVVSVSSATAPVAGQVLTATSPTAATWQAPGIGAMTQSELHASRAMGTVYQNTSGKTMLVTVSTGTSNSGPSAISAFIGPTSSPSTLYSGAYAPLDGAAYPFTVTMTVPNSWYYTVTVNLRTDGTVHSWWETVLPF